MIRKIAPNFETRVPGLGERETRYNYLPPTKRLRLRLGWDEDLDYIHSFYPKLPTNTLSHKQIFLTKEKSLLNNVAWACKNGPNLRGPK